MDQKFNGDPSKWEDYSSRFSYMIGGTYLIDVQNIGYLQDFWLEKPKQQLMDLPQTGTCMKMR